MTGAHILTLAGIPIRATLGFLLLIVYIGYRDYDAGMMAIAGTVLGLVTSVLIHELGHALVARHYKLAPEIELRFFGGACAHQHARKDRHDVFIIAAGPLLQIAVGVIVWVIAREVVSGGMGRFAYYFVENFLYFSIYYGFANLVLPIYPLDGGQLFRLLMLRLARPAAKAERIVHIVGLVGGLAVVVYALVGQQQIFLALLAGYAVIENFRWMVEGGPAPIRVRSELADKLLVEATTAAQAGEWHEARRLAFQARDEKTITDDQLAKIFAIVVVASAELRDWSEALGWAKRAPKTPAVFVAKLRALCGSGQRDQARAELEASDAPRLEAGVRALVERWIDGSVAP